MMYAENASADSNPKFSEGPPRCHSGGSSLYHRSFISKCRLLSSSHSHFACPSPYVKGGLRFPQYPPQGNNCRNSLTRCSPRGNIAELDTAEIRFRKPRMSRSCCV